MHKMFTAGMIYKLLTIGGPMSVFSLIAGLGVFAVTVTTIPANEHTDVYVAISLGLVLLGFVEWALARRFSAHEANEHVSINKLLESQSGAFGAAMTEALRPFRAEFDYLKNIFDGAMAGTKSQTDAFEQLTKEVQALRADISQVRADNEHREHRLREIEIRLGRLPLTK